MAEPVRHSPVVGQVASMREAQWSGASLEAASFLAFVSVRVGPTAGAQVKSALGTDLPEPGRTSTSALGDVLWLGPDEWLIVGADGAGPAAESSLRSAVGADGAVVDLSGNYTGLILRGPAAREVLATCCALDLHPTAFAPGQCAATMLGKVGMIIQQLDPEPTYRIFVRPSVAGYAIGWLVEGMKSVRAAAAYEKKP